MKDTLKDIAYCLKIALYIFFAMFLFTIVVLLIVSQFKSDFSIREILVWGCRVVEYTSVFGLALCVISFTKQDLGRPLNYQREWEMYFKKFNLPFVIFFISVFLLFISFIVENIIIVF